MAEVGGYAPPPLQEVVKPTVARAPETGASAADFSAAEKAVENPNAPNQILTPTAEGSLAELQGLGLDFTNKTAEALAQEAVAHGRPNDGTTKQAVEQSLRLYRAQEALQKLDDIGVSLEGQTADTIIKTLHDPHGPHRWQDDEPTRQYVEDALVLQKERTRPASVEQNTSTEQSAPASSERVADTTSQRQETGPVSPESEVARQRKQLNVRYEQLVRFNDRNTTNEERSKDPYLVQALTIDTQARDAANPDLGYGRYQVGINPDRTPRIVDIHESIGPNMARAETIAAETVTREDGTTHPTPRALEAKEFLNELKPHLVENPDGPGHSFEVADPTKPARNEQTKREDLNLMKADRHLEDIVKILMKDYPKDEKMRDLAEQLLVARQAGGSLANMDIHAAIKYHAILTGYDKLSSSQQHSIGLSKELINTMHAQIPKGADRLRTICRETGGLTEDELQTLGGMLMGGTMADFLEPMTNYSEAPDDKTRNKIMGKMSETQQKIVNNKRLRRELNTAIFGSAEGISAQQLEQEQDTYMKAGKAETLKSWRKTGGKWTAIGLGISVFAMMSKLQAQEKAINE